MPTLMSMEDLFYGPREATWILPPREEEPLRRYRERDYSPPRRFLKPEPSIRPLERYEPRRVSPNYEQIRPIERLARVHTVPEPVPVTEEIRKVVEGPPTQVVTHPVPPAPPVQVAPRAISPPRPVSPPRPIIHHPIEMKVPMCCEKCARKVKDRLETLEGVESVVTDQYNQKVTVYGHADPERVLTRVRMVKKRSAFWDMTVDYSERYRRARQAEVEAAARENAKRVEVKKQEAKAKAMVAPANHAQVVVKLPQEQNEPQVTAILPPERNRPMAYAPERQVHNPARFVSPPRTYRQELHHGPLPQEMHRRPEFYNGMHPV